MDYTFSLIDYSLIIVMLLVTVCMGIYYGFFKKQSTATEYLLGGKQMGTWPIAFSLVSSILSPVPLVMFPTEIYRYGIQCALSTPMVIIAQLLSYYVYLPVFYKLQVTSTYEYLQLRFNNKVRIFASLLCTLFMFLYLPLVIYVPALTVALVTGIEVYYLTPIICSVCIFYTTVGGLKAVVWTDAVQCIFMFLSIFAVMVLGIIATGGMERIWNINHHGGRLKLDFDLDMTKKETVWAGTISMMAIWMTLMSVNQSTVQKYLSLPSFKEVKGAVSISTVGIVLLMGFTFFTGVVIYAKYYDCDPMMSQHINRHDQLLPYFLSDVGGNIPGLPGLFVAGVLSASLSTLSASLNCLAATIYEDFISPFVAPAISQRKVSLILKMMVLVIGILCTVLVYVVEQLGGLLSLSATSIGLATGPLLGLFTVGMLLPMVNTKGAMAGGITSLLLLTWIIFGSQWYQYNKILQYPELPTSVQGCNASTTLSLSNVSHVPTATNVFFIYKISYFHYAMIGVITVAVVSVIVSYFTKNERRRVNRDCITPIAQFLILHQHIVEYSETDKSINDLQKEQNDMLLQDIKKQ